VSEPLSKHSDAWRAALSDLSQQNLKRFLEEHPDWTKRLLGREIEPLDPEARRTLGSELVAELGPATRSDASTYRRLDELRTRSETASDASYRMSVREAALLRMQTVLMEVAAEVYLKTRAPEDERRAWERLRECEDLAFPVSSVRPPSADREPFPAWADDLELARTVLPAWMGIQFAQASPELRAAQDLSEGAVTVQRVYPGSPAEAAGIEAGDVILGPPGEHFQEPRQIREWTMLSQVDEPRKLDILRDRTRIRRTLVPGSHPGQFPELPAPPGAGDAAPPLKLSAYRAEPPASLAGNGPHLLFFWATWCAPCKQSLPELLAYGEATGVPIVAITDEPSQQLDAFFEQFEGGFPQTVAVDRNRATFLAYGVSGTPTFVLVGSDGVVQSTSTGYSRDKGIGIDGWKWGG
jgi:thiol-disulfide isomerase/thioredoxin